MLTRLRIAKAAAAGSERTRRVSWRRAAVVLRGERVQLHSLADRTDRTLRTLAARRCAADVYDRLRRAASHSWLWPRERAIDLFVTRSGWTRVAPEQVACVFGRRRSVITVPATAAAEDLASLMTRTEIRVLLGDTNLDLVTQLQMIAACELRRLFTTG